MREPTSQEKQQYERMIELSHLARQRYLEAGGDPRRAADESYLTESEKAEYFTLGRSLFGIEINNNEVHCQGHSWKLSKLEDLPRS